jgi:hypothetical protein
MDLFLKGGFDLAKPPSPIAEAPVAISLVDCAGAQASWGWSVMVRVRALKTQTTSFLTQDECGWGQLRVCVTVGPSKLELCRQKVKTSVASSLHLLIFLPQ